MATSSLKSLFRFHCRIFTVLPLRLALRGIWDENWQCGTIYDTSYFNELPCPVFGCPMSTHYIYSFYPVYPWPHSTSGTPGNYPRLTNLRNSRYYLSLALRVGTNTLTFYQVTETLVSLSKNILICIWMVYWVVRMRIHKWFSLLLDTDVFLYMCL